MPVIKKYPELDQIAVEISERVAFEINQRTELGKISKETKEECRYCAQHTLEMLIQLLEAKV